LQSAFKSNVFLFNKTAKQELTLEFISAYFRAVIVCNVL